MGNKYLTATEAHKFSIESECTINRIYKFIDCAAKENRYRLCYDFVDTDPSVIQKILDNLRNNGYKVTPVEGDDTSYYAIQW